MNWVKKYKLLVFNLAQDHQVDLQVLKEIPGKEIMKWIPFLKKELISTI